MLAFRANVLTQNRHTLRRNFHFHLPEDPLYLRMAGVLLASQRQPDRSTRSTSGLFISPPVRYALDARGRIHGLAPAFAALEHVGARSAQRAFVAGTDRCLLPRRR